MTDQSQPAFGWGIRPPLVPPLRLSIMTTMSPDAAAAALATAIREKHYADPRAAASPFLRLIGTQTGPMIDLRVVFYILPGVWARGPGLRLRGLIVERGAGSELALDLTTPDTDFGRLPIVGPILVEGDRGRLAGQGEVVRRLLVEILGG
jgi:hypothetical protein